jgi:hypothetical protein
MRRYWIPAACLATGIVVLLVFWGQTGCSDCANNCPNTQVTISAPTNIDLPITMTGQEGPACPNYPILCRGGGAGTRCTYFTVTAPAPGICDVTLTFSDGRPPMVVRTEFGPTSDVGCCRGYPVVGDDLFIISPAADGGITVRDGATTDATWIADPGTDGGAPPDAASAD